MKYNSRAFVNQFFVGLLVTICCGGSVGLGTVWMRHQISITANTNRVLKANLDELERKIAERTAVVESEQNPENLRQLNADFRLGLVPMSDAQVGVMPVAEDPVRRMAMRANRALFTDVAEAGALGRPDDEPRAPVRDAPLRVTFALRR